MKKQLLSLSDLYNFFCLQGKDMKFSAIDNDASIVVHVEEPLTFESVNDDNDQLKVNLRLCHTEKNVNQSFISTEVMEKAISSAYNMPILGYIWEDEEGVARFAGHEFYMDGDEIVYEEIPVGCIPESAGLKLVDSEDERKYLEGEGIIWRTYSKAAEILEREKDLSVSVELDVRSLSFNAKDKVLNIEDFIFTGVTILQANPENGKEIKPGMQGACVSVDSLENFSKEENSMFSNEIREKLVELEEKIDSLANFEINHNPKKKGGEDVAKKEFEAEDAAVEVAEATEQAEDVAAEETTSEEVVAEEVAEEAAEETIEDEPKDDEVAEESTEEVSEEDAEVAEESTEEVAEGEVAETAETFSRTFELSHDDIRCGLYALLTPFEEEDNDWYGIVEVYDNYFVYQGMFDASHIFKQEYTKDGDAISFTGERVHLNAEYLTDNELAELNAMRSNYSEVTEKLAKYEAEPQKVEKIQSEEYSMIRDTEEFKKIESDHFDLSVEDITKTLDDAVLKYAKANKLNYAANEEKPTVGRKVFAFGSTGKFRPYGGLIKNKE